MCCWSHIGHLVIRNYRNKTKDEGRRVEISTKEFKTVISMAQTRTR